MPKHLPDFFTRELCGGAYRCRGKAAGGEDQRARLASPHHATGPRAK
jgi:hypothetical protein